jgi:carbamoyl-phosphate synthase large subunit
MKRKVLITSVAGLTGVYISKVLMSFQDLDLYGVDIVDQLIFKQDSIRYFKGPRIDTGNFLDFIMETISSYEIDYIIPTSSHDVDFFSINSKVLLSKAKFLISDSSVHEIFSDKQKSYKELKKLGISTPKELDGCYPIAFPLIWKPFKSSGSKRIYVLNNLNDLNYFKEKNDGFLSEFIEGEEFTCDCFFGNNGECLGYLVRTRDEVVSGAVVRTTNIDIDISDIILKFTKIRTIRGPLNFQFKIRNNDIIVFDINDRLASGGTPLSVRLGFNIPRLIIDELDGNARKFTPCKSQKITMVRYYEEYFIEN